MATIEFVNQSSVITADWCNDVDALVYDILSAPTTATEVLTALDAGIASIAGLTTAADKMIYTTALDTYAVADLSAFARTLLDDASASAARTTLGVAIGTDVQAYDAGLLSIAGLTTAADKMIYTTALDTYAVTDLSAFARTLLDDANAAAALATLGAAASGANSDITSLSALSTPLSVAQGGTGAATFTDAGVLIGNGTGAVQVTSAGTAGHVLVSNGAGVDPTFQNVGTVTNGDSHDHNGGDGAYLTEDSHTALATGTTVTFYSDTQEQTANNAGVWEYKHGATSGDTTSNQDESEQFSFRILRSGVYTCSFEIKNDTVGVTYGRFLQNGALIGSQQSETGSTYSAKSQDLTFSAGDLVEVQVQNLNGGRPYFMQNVLIRNAYPLLG